MLSIGLIYYTLLRATGDSPSVIDSRAAEDTKWESKNRGSKHRTASKCLRMRMLLHVQRLAKWERALSRERLPYPLGGCRGL